MADGATTERDARRVWWRAVAWAVAYVAIARGVGNLYPFSTFEMYGGTQLTSSSRIAVVTDDGIAEVERFGHWRCEAPPSADPRVCRAQWPFFHIEAVDRAALAWIAQAPPPDGASTRATVVRRVWRLGSETITTDCVLAACEVAP